jgi:predicted RNA methylase
MTISIERHILEILEQSTLQGVFLRLPSRQLDRATYAAVNKVIEAAGGKWSRSKKAHVFDGDAAEVIEPILLTGQYSRTKQDFGQFDTPEDIADYVVGLADIAPGMEVLEPSAGIGKLVDPIERAGGRVTAFEIDAKRLNACTARFALSGGAHLCDFMTVVPEEEDQFDRVVMNPPFAKRADIRHVTHACAFLKPGGRVVAIMSAAITFRSDALAVKFRDFVRSFGGTIDSLPEGAFKSSGTMVNTVVVVLNAPVRGARQ